MQAAVQRLSCVARVLKKYSYSKTMMFLDIMARLDCNNLAIFSVVIKSDDKNGLLNDFDILDVHAGDIVQLTGILETDENRELIDSRKEMWNISTIVINKSESCFIKKIGEWSIEHNGTFYFDELKFLDHKTTQINQFDGVIQPPSIVLQAKNKSVEKTIDLLRDKYVRFSFRESSTSLPKSKDRMILATLNNSSDSDKMSIEEFASNDILSQSITRVYAMNYKSSPFVVHPDLDTAIELMKVALAAHTTNKETNSTEGAVRIQAFPRYVAGHVVDYCDREWPTQQVHWSPSEYSHILSAVYIDALWMLSLIPRTELAIADIYESNNKFGSKNIGTAPKVVVPGTTTSANSNNSEATTETTQVTAERVCKSANKLHEILTRNDWIYDSVSPSTDRDSVPEKTLHSYGLCIDIGASPGGWTTYLASNISSQRVIGVDRGALLIDPLPAHVEHWQVLGQVAVDRLYAQSLAAEERGEEFERIDLYCCDANISPALSTALLIKCSVEYKLLRPNARFVLTLKNTLFQKGAWETAKSDSFAALSAHFREVRVVSLLANTPKECTITGIFSS